LSSRGVVLCHIARPRQAPPPELFASYRIHLASRVSDSAAVPAHWRLAGRHLVMLPTPQILRLCTTAASHPTRSPCGHRPLEGLTKLRPYLAPHFPRTEAAMNYSSRGLSGASANCNLLECCVKVHSVGCALRLNDALSSVSAPEWAVLNDAVSSTERRSPRGPRSHTLPRPEMNKAHGEHASASRRRRIQLTVSSHCRPASLRVVNVVVLHATP
jgi:hypothetical protein